MAAEFTRALRPFPQRHGTHPRFRDVLFTADETVFHREPAPLTGFHPAVFPALPGGFWAPRGATRRSRAAVTDSAVHKTA